MKRLCLLLAFGLGTWCIFAQNLTQAEYFVDIDPGVGAGINVPFTAATSITNLQVSVPVTTLGNGLHAIFFRVKDANNVWSTTERTYFYKAVIPTITETPTPAAVNITKAEYFIDTDPGAGLGTNIPITSGLTITDVAIPVPVSTLTEGLHQLLVRVRNANGIWSTTERTYFYKLAIPTITETPTPAAVNLTKAEYFIDTDPGIGLGINIPITSGLAISDVVLQVPVTSLSEGLHQILVRVRNANGVWSTTERTYFYKKTIPTITETPTPPAVNITKAEYFIDTDPGVGAGTNIPITAGTIITDLITPVSVSSLSEGIHKLYLRVRNANGVWSTTEVATFSVCNGNVPAAAAASAVTTSGFTANWATTTSALSYQLDVSADNFATFVSGYNAKVINAPTTSEAVTGLNQATTYKYRVRGYRTCASVSSSVITVGIPVATPPSQPTNMVFIAPGPTDINVSFTPPATLPGGYLVVRRAGAYSTFVPVNNTSYSQGQPVGDGFVAYADAPPLLGDVGLTPNTNYYYTVYAYNQLNGFISYQTTAPLKGNSFTLAAEPSAQPTALQFSNVTSTSYQVSYSAAAGNPSGYIVLRKAGSEPASVPVDGTPYTTTVGSDAIAYQGSALTFNETSLVDNTTYHYAIYAYNGSQTSLNYNTLNPLRGSQLTPLTPSAAATNLQFSNITTSAITGSYTAPVPASAGYVIVRKQGSASSFVPQLNTPYNVGPVTDGTIIYVGPNTTFTDTGLTASTIYFYTVFSFNQNGTLISYQTVPPLQGSVSTFTAEPTAQATSLSFNPITSTSLTLTFTAANPVPGGYLAIRKDGSAPTFRPNDGQDYTLGSTHGDAVIAHKGAGLFFDNSGLSPGTVYHFIIFSFNGSGAASNYNTTVTASNSGSKITVPPKPVVLTANNVQQNGFTARWNPTTGATNYRLDVSDNNFVSMLPAFDNLTINTTSISVTGLQPGIVYKYRVRATNESGISVNSDEMQQITIPAAPVTNAGTNVSQTGFTFSWSAMPGTTGYFVDVSLDDFVTFTPGFQNFSTTQTSVVVTGLQPGKTYKFRVRSTNSGGTSPSSNPPGQQLLIPATPEVLDPVNVTSQAFTSKWNSAEGASGYLLDVSLESNSFSPNLPNYNSLVVAGALEKVVEQLNPSTAYSYRVSASNATGISPYSAVKSVSTQAASTGGSLALSNFLFPVAIGSANIKASVEITGGTRPYTVKFFHRPIAKTSFIEATPIEVVSGKYEANITPAMADKIGVEFYFDVTDGTGTNRKTATESSYRSVPTEGIKIPFSRFGGKLEDYELFSMPYQLTNKTIVSIFEDDLGSYDKSKWRLFRYRYSDDKNVEYQAGLSEIELGKGYWFNRKENIDVRFSGGTVNPVTRDNPLTLTLEVGWNQIGNPFPFDVQWSAVLAANNNPGGIGELKVYQASSVQLVNNNTLKEWGGGFVLNSNTATVQLQFPVSLSPEAGGRNKSSEDRISGMDLNKPVWHFPISVSQANREMEVGFGMHPDAKELADWYDDHVPPRWGNVLEMYVDRPEFFVPKFSRDIVPTQPEYTWNIIFESSKPDAVTLRWDNAEPGKSDAELIMMHIDQNTFVDMKKSNHYTFTPNGLDRFTILFASTGGVLPHEVLAGSPYPNPMRDQTQIPFSVPEDNSRVEISVSDSFGRQLNTLTNTFYNRGIHTVEWKGNAANGTDAANGFYYILLKINGQVYIKRILKL